MYRSSNRRSPPRKLLVTTMGPVIYIYHVDNSSMIAGSGLSSLCTLSSPLMPYCATLPVQSIEGKEGCH